MYAVIESGGKQFKVSPGQVIDVDIFPVEGDSVELEKVHLIADGDDIVLGNPTIDGARVVADVVGEFRRDKVIVFKYKPKTRYRVKKGHRQPCMRLAIKEIIRGSGKE
ncbi:MAG: 50S ribosomal protein L21 [Dehalococcoidia bacterium]|nr:50S ribosomal protein L21 [Dehalococcoidia bacterium]